MKTIPVRDAVGTVLCHDITRIVPGGEKGPVFRKGHVIRPQDIEVLLSVGKEHLFVYEQLEGMVHENEAAERLINALAGENLGRSAVKEGRIDLIAETSGLLVVDSDALLAVNSLGGITVATLHSYQYVQRGAKVAGARIVPLMIEEERLAQVEKILPQPLICIRPLAKARVGIVTTGSEVAAGRISDGFGPVLRQKFAFYGSTVAGQTIVTDDEEKISSAINDFLHQDLDMVVVTGGMSVDPDDRTPSAIRAAGASIISYGAPVYPGAMFLLAMARHGARDIPVLGLPGCVMYYKSSIFDLMVPRLLAGLTVTARDVAALGHGGFCQQCPECHYPVCPFGK